MEIIISNIRVENSRKGFSRLVADIKKEGVGHEVWFEVPERYGQYLTFERSDAFVIAMLNQAMRDGCDICCNAPMTEELLFQLNEYLIPSLAKYGRKMYASRIKAASDGTPLSSAGAVGTGMSCGVDSLHSLFMHDQNSLGVNLKLTHLTLFNVGAYRKGSQQRDWQRNHARHVAECAGLPLLETDSNLAEVYPRDHHLMHTYSNMFGVYALRKLWKTYYYGSWGMDYGAFSLKDNELHDAAFYELLSLDAFSIPQLKIYSEGATKSKFEKIRDIVDYPIAHENLHVCVADTGPNCGMCAKCRRTLMMLDALGALDKFSHIFDLALYRRHKSHFLSWLAWNHINYHVDMFLDETYNGLRNEIGLKEWMAAYTAYPIKAMRDVLMKQKKRRHE